jgi:hypothetical protein
MFRTFDDRVEAENVWITFEARPVKQRLDGSLEGPITHVDRI